MTTDTSKAGEVIRTEEEWSMAICPCTGITIRQAEKAIADGARSTEEVFERCNEIVYCSKCMVDIDDMVFAVLRRERDKAQNS
jgi:bacterioferritin-associated ferredoxin